MNSGRTTRKGVDARDTTHQKTRKCGGVQAMNIDWFHR